MRKRKGILIMKDNQLELIVETRVCRSCNIEKPIDRFHKRHRLATDSRDTLCAACSNEGRNWRRKERKKYEHLTQGFVISVKDKVTVYTLTMITTQVNTEAFCVIFATLV